MQKLNSKGFALAEILVVTVFVMIIFSIIYTNFYPIMAEYERRESYDDVDGKYAAYWFKRIAEKNKFASINTSIIDSDHYKEFDCNSLSSDKELCENLVNKYGVTKMYITDYNTSDVKSIVSSAGFSSGLLEYITYLPNYDGTGYRIIIEFHRTKDENDYYAYATMEVSR